jgi:hypothetical protein
MLRAKARARTSSRLHTRVAGVPKRMKHKIYNKAITIYMPKSSYWTTGSIEVYPERLRSKIVGLCPNHFEGTDQ